MATAKRTVAKKAAPAADKGLNPISEITLGTKKRDKTGPKQKLSRLSQRYSNKISWLAV